MSAPPAPKPLHLRVASAIVPDAGKRAIDRVRTRAYRRRIAPLREEYVRRYGLEVLRGPFAGLRYTPELPAHEHISHHLMAKLVGSYEQQIYPWIEEWIAKDLGLVIDVGCAEGFYAVGLARAMPTVEVRAYDIYEQARADCAELARANGVQDRVLIGGECTPSTLAAVSEARVALLSDCEGYEKILLDPELAPNLRNWSIIVEQHVLHDPTIAATIERRFRDTHEIEVIEYVPPDGAGVAELEWLTDEQIRFVLSERPFPMSWAMLRPRAGGP
jgi:precorrin-6B methylase 2